MPKTLVPFESPTSIIVAAPSNCGKTYLVKKILENADDMFTVPPSEIIYCYGSTWQRPIFDEMKQKISNITFHEGVPDQETLLTHTFSNSHTICVLDDLMLEIANNPQAEKLFYAGVHHYNITIIL